MPAPYTIEQAADMSGLSVKYIRRLKSAMPLFFETHTERGLSNALLFDEELIEVLKRMKDLKHRGRTLREIRDEITAVASRRQQKEERKEERVQEENVENIPITDMLKRENEMLANQVNLLKNLLQRAEERFDRLLPAPGQSMEGVLQKKEPLKSQLLMWLVEAVVVTSFAAGFIFMIWLFAQRAFSL